MTQFEFVMMVAAVVVAMGLAEIVGGWGRLLRARQGSITFDWLHLGMSLMIAMGTLQYWVGMWAYEPLAIDTGFQIMMLVVPSFFLVVSSYAISPDPALLEKQSCREYYMSKRAAIFIPLAISFFLSVIADGAIAGFDRVELSTWVVFGVWGGLVVLLAFSQGVWIHSALMLLGFVQISVFFLTSEISTLNARLVE